VGHFYTPRNTNHVILNEKAAKKSLLFLEARYYTLFRDYLKSAENSFAVKVKKEYCICSSFKIRDGSGRFSIAVYA